MGDPVPPPFGPEVLPGRHPRAPRQAKTWDKARRLSRLVHELEARRSTTAQLAQRFGVGQRSIQRDIEALREMGHDVVEHRNKEYSIPRSGTLLRPAEALAAYAAIRLAHHHSPALNSHYRQALQSISLTLPERIRHTLNASVRDNGATPFVERQMEQVAAAWMDQRVLSFDYRRPNGTLETGNELCVYFIEISRTNLAPYVIGLERRHRGKVRTFKLSRMHNLCLLPDTYEPDPEFEPRDFLSDAWGVIGGEATVAVTVRFAPEAAYRVLEGGFPNATLIRQDGHVDMEFRAGTDATGLPRELLPFLLSWGPRAEVLSPPDVREAWLSELREALRRYDRPGGGEIE
ncbi:transcriptional regulator [Deinococcus metallilatus]|uniref:Transcriptional regulator n=1 Tax=Deinococcus metallilatus TaxID=1211322 RepID=A0AAJ5F3Z3_9DEIO|nr:transcriptional regulator [Deinococcus metallilatus]MBB5294936.1 putative DNA-binding transcriptional regulator YafY [Deinococcus metallilatus]QBY09360.1 transcriptional regulator [Deinococcus metallilatus]RXJ09365.1 transcriptional regulator [Deinococcus metallilatus]TLK28887.1 transcriptional regulator [Deinococcus metallilatus]GMA16866.1 DNA-binding transcriptional regulator [Deinococcus metallilatus]